MGGGIFSSELRHGLSGGNNHWENATPVQGAWLILCAGPPIKMCPPDNFRSCSGCIALSMNMNNTRDTAGVRRWN